MTNTAQHDGIGCFADKAMIQRIVAEQNERMGFAPIPGANAELVRNKILALGVRPEDNMASCGIIAAREE
jgi:hypothetical protein